MTSLSISRALYPCCKQHHGRAIQAISRRERCTVPGLRMHSALEKHARLPTWILCGSVKIGAATHRLAELTRRIKPETNRTSVEEKHLEIVCDECMSISTELLERPMSFTRLSTINATGKKQMIEYRGKSECNCWIPMSRTTSSSRVND